MVNTIRWVFTPISAIFGWYLVFIIALVLFGYVNNLCPPEKEISSFCSLSWINDLSNAMIPIGAGLSAVAVVLLPTLVAPKHKLRVATLFYSVGLLTALWMLFGRDILRFLSGDNTLPFSSSGFGLLLAPTIAGLITLLLIRFYLLRQLRNPT